MKITKCINCGNEEDFNLNIYQMHPRDVEPILYESRCECADCNMSGQHMLSFSTKKEAQEAAIQNWNLRMEKLSKINITNG